MERGAEDGVGGGSDLRCGISGAGRRDCRRLAQVVSIEVGCVCCGSFIGGRLVGARGWSVRDRRGADVGPRDQRLESHDIHVCFKAWGAGCNSVNDRVCVSGHLSATWQANRLQ